jgi:hypothetical protein
MSTVRNDTDHACAREEHPGAKCVGVNDAAC